MREFRSYGSVRGVLGNRHPYRDRPIVNRPTAVSFRHCSWLAAANAETRSHSEEAG
jgi:hypothetical protein